MASPAARRDAAAAGAAVDAVTPTWERNEALSGSAATVPDEEIFAASR
jgi:hypothetical protein